MPCPTCDHTMQQLTNGVFWCPRCGTLRRDGVDEFSIDMQPMLVKRCRQFTQDNGEGWEWKKLWHRLGIQEAIHPPGRDIQ
jgi:hypothetical protein